ncbi:Nucleolar and coiled-body phosphoprotein 1 [Beauveria bassiana]|nr:Nucleolar and coiled-body phosphoprotein 1 [Beauveria bassiana]
MSAPPAWLFSNNSDAVAAATPTAADPKTTPDRPSTRTMGKKGGSTAVAAPAAPALLMDIVERFLKDHAFTDAHKAFRAQRKEKGLVTKDKDIVVAGPTLDEVFAWWQRAAAKIDEDSADSSDSSESSDSSDDDENDSSDEEEVTKKQEVTKSLKRKAPESDSDSSEEDSDSDLNEAKPQAKKVKKEKSTKDSSDSSVTLDRASPVAEPPLPPAPVAKRKQNEPFSRIPKNIKVDARFASNEWVPMDYSQRAHEDLIITKGKGFTKAKNKMKKGSFRGGVIDITEKKAVYFED